MLCEMSVGRVWTSPGSMVDVGDMGLGKLGSGLRCGISSQCHNDGDKLR